MTLDLMLGSVGIYVMVISALALGVERIMDLIKSFSRKHLVREPVSEKAGAEERKTHEKKEEVRKRNIRVWAIPIGIILAILTQIDTFDILGFPSPMWFGFPILGWIVSGFAASRGSAFWHDIIDLIGTIRDTKRQVATASRG